MSALNSGYRVGSSRNVLSLMERGARGVFFSGIAVSAIMRRAVRNSNKGCSVRGDTAVVPAQRTPKIIGELLDASSPIL